MNNKNESGRSMVEMLGVLSIMGVIMYGAIAGINYGIDLYKINATHTEVEELAQTLVDLFSWTQNYSALKGASGHNVDISKADKILCDNDAFPNCSSAGVMTSQWGTSVTVSPSNDQGQDCAGDECVAFTITYNDVPYLACERLLHDLEFVNACPIAPAECQNTNDMVFLLSNGSCL